MIDLVLDRLRARYGPPRVHRWLPPLDELVLTILSQNTSDRNCERAYAAMRERFPTWEEVRDAPTAELERVLRPGGLAAQKAPRIQAVLQQLSAGRPAPTSTGSVACGRPRRWRGSSLCPVSGQRRRAACCSSAWTCR